MFRESFGDCEGRSWWFADGLSCRAASQFLVHAVDSLWSVGMSGRERVSQFFISVIFNRIPVLVAVFRGGH